MGGGGGGGVRGGEDCLKWGWRGLGQFSNLREWRGLARKKGRCF